jgi:hypothetical protein
MGVRRILKLPNQGQAEFYEDQANGTSKVVLKAPATLGADATFELPAVDGAAGQVLKTDGAGVLSFAAASATPAAHAASHQDGGSDEVATATPTANSIPKAGASSRLDTGWLGSGAADATKYLRGDQAWATTADLTGRPQEYFRQVGTSPLHRWYAAGVVGNAVLGGSSPIDGSINATPFASLRGGTLDRIRIYVSSAGGASSMVRLAIYQAASETNLYPDALVLDVGELSAASTGWKTFTISQALTPNCLYWFAMLATSGGGTVPEFLGFSSGSFYQVLGWPETAASGDESRLHFSKVQAYGAAPDPFPSNATPVAASLGLAIMGRYLS